MNSGTTGKPDSNAVKPRRFVFVLLDDFTLLCFAAAVESLRIANRMADETLYDWVLAGEGGERGHLLGGGDFQRRYGP